jgi:hypothetical protein
MHKELSNILDLTITNWTSFTLFPNFNGTFIATANVNEVLVQKYTIFRIYHAKATHAQVAIVNVFR